MPPEKRIADRTAISGTVSRALSKFFYLLSALSLCLRQKSAVSSSKTNDSAKYSGKEVIPMYSAVLSKDIPYGSMP